MSSSDLEDELGAIDAIYPGAFELLHPRVYSLTVPSNPGLQVVLAFPLKYPDEIPFLINVNNNDPSKYPDTAYIENKTRSALEKVFNPGEVCLFDLLTEMELFLERYNQNQQNEKVEVRHEQEKSNGERELAYSKKIDDFPLERTTSVSDSIPNTKYKILDPLEGWSQSHPIVDRGSTFIGYAKDVHSVEEAEEALDILTTDKKIAKASHNMSSWRIKKDNGIQYQDCDDDGETAAGGRILHLLTVCQLCSFLYLFIFFFLFHLIEFLTGIQTNCNFR